jgi:uncharacterized membrane protein
MDLTVAAPAALWLLLVVPGFWVAIRFGRTNFGQSQQWLQAFVRSMVVALLAFALAQPVLSFRSRGTSIVYAVDVSHSVSGAAIERAASRIDALTSELRPEHSAIVAFGLSATGIADTDALRALADPERADELARSESDLESALVNARATLEPGRAPRIVLFSDGRETRGDVRAAAARLAASAIPVFVETMGVRNVGDVWIDGVTLPDRVLAGSLTAVHVVIGSQREARVTLALIDRGRRIGERTLEVARGRTDVVVDAAFDAPGTRVIEAELRVDGDPLALNNRLAGEVIVEPRSRVMYVEGALDRSKYLAEALAGAGFEVAVRPPGDLPSTVDGLEPWDAIVLSDVPRSALPDSTMRTLATWVEREGGGLLVAGGPNVFGVGATPTTAGYRHSELERLTPVTFERNDEPAVALVIVLDKSWSMAGSVISLCKAAAQAAVDVLSDEHLVGVLTFNDRNSWDVTVRPVGPNRPSIARAIEAIEPSGYTMIYPAIEQAYEALAQTNARAKHVVLLSDGRSGQQDYEGLLKKMVSGKITVSSVAVGPGADAELLASIAEWGKGRSYVVQDPRQVAQIFVTEARTASTPAFEEGSAIQPIVRMPGVLSGVDLARMPPLHGRTTIVLKDHALDVLSTAEGDPLLAMWPIGLGRTAVFASDVKDRWGRDWVNWRGYGPFFAAVVHAIERPRPPAFEMRPGVVRSTQRTVMVGIEARDAMGRYRNLLSPTLRVQIGGHSPVDLPARQVEPGRYEAEIVAGAADSVTVSRTDPDGTTTSRVLVPDAQAEYRFRAADLDLLRSVARLTGGGESATADALRKVASSHPAVRRALWPVLVALALVLWLADVLLRRVRLFEQGRDPT